MKNTNCLANLKPARQGEIRNPKGKSKGIRNTTTLINKWLKSKEKGDKPIFSRRMKLSQLDVIVLKQLQKARKGDTAAFNALLDRMEGKL